MPVAEHPTPTVRGHKTIGLPCPQEQDERIVENPQLFRELLDQQIEANPELFPPEIQRGHRMKDLDTSAKPAGDSGGLIVATTGATWYARPS